MAKNRLYNYSGLANKEQKIYSIGDTKISATGISISFLKITAPTAIIGTIIGLVINGILGTHFYAIGTSSFNFTYILATTGLGIAIGLGLWYIPVQNYKLYEWILAYFRPKYIYNNEGQIAKRQKYTNIKVEGIVEGSL